MITGHDPDRLLREARHIAETLNCLDADPWRRPCGACAPCRQFAAGAFPYWFLLMPEGASNIIKIKQIRELQSMLATKAGEGRVKTAVLIDAHRMREDSQNCFLKTLEEPPEDTVLMLLTNRPQDLLPTVRSRCRMLDVRDNAQIPDKKDLELAGDILQAMHHQGFVAVFEKAAFVNASRKQGVKDFFGAMEYLLRNILIESLCPPAGGPLANRAKRTLAALEQVWRAGYLLERNVNSLLVIENLFLKLYRLEISAAEGG